MIDSYPYPGGAAGDYNTGWTATMTNQSSSQTESFQTWAMCQYARPDPCSYSARGLS